MPTTPFIGVRISWLITARNWVLAKLAPTASWRARGAAYHIPNFRNLPTLITHGAWDRAIGGGVPKWTIPYLMMLLTLEKLALAYWLYQLQVGAFSIHAYYGGAHFNGLYLMLLGGFILRPYVAKLVDVHVFFVALM